MSTIVVKRGPRERPEEPPAETIELQEPPLLPEPAARDMSSLLMTLPAGIGSLVLVVSFSGVGGTGASSYLIGGGLGVSMIAMGVSQLGRAAADRRRKMRGERRDYLRYLAQLRTRAARAADVDRRARLREHPDPASLWSLVLGSRLWERRTGHDDFARVRIGLGQQPAGLELVPPATRPVEDLDPLCAVSLRRFSEAFRTVPGVPIAVGLRSFPSVEFDGEPDAAVALVRAMLGQLATLHSPDDLVVAVLSTEEELPGWEWVKWLPHNRHGSARDAAGPVRLMAADHEELMDLLGPDVTDRPEHDRQVPPSSVEPFVVVVAHLAPVPPASRLRGGGLRNAVLLDLTGTLPGGPDVLRLTVTADELTYPAGPGEQAVATPDALHPAEALTLGRLLAPRRTSGTVELSDHPLDSDFGLGTLLGVPDLHTFDVAAQWRPRTVQRARLSAPIGITEGGEVVELDIKESAQGGMGPHGLLIGATGSGKSELLRTLILSLAATHSSEILNLVLVDFKGGATFIGMDRLPHTSAVITNLADELPLVDRMQESLNGELTRRQELLRASGFPSLFDYERARLAGEQLAPLPSLLLVVDEFGELLAGKPEFMDLFVQIGRVGRSLGVHLLLASQRLDEGRISRVEGHLSYRIALRTFSSMESRSVIGAGLAHELPSEPGNGYLRTDTSTLIRFKAAYVSGPAPAPLSGPVDPAVVDRANREVAPFVAWPHPHLHMVSERSDEEPEPAPEPVESAGLGTPSVAEVIAGRLLDAGPAARQVWLPPLSTPPTLDDLLPSVLPHPRRGMTVDEPAMRGRLRVPVGVVDRPQEQVRELLVADLSGADGHVAVVGAPQSGKSTLLRTLVLGLALTHTPEEVQVYGLDFGGGGLASIAGLPHVGSVATRLDRDRVVRTVAEIQGIVARREQAFARLGVESMAAYHELRRSGQVDDPHGEVFLVVDGWFSIKNDYSDLETAFGELGSRGLSFGVHLVIAATRWSEIRPWLRDLLGTRFELRLGDPMESEIGTRKAATVPAQPGRGMTPKALHFLTALPRLDGVAATADLAGATRVTVEEVRTYWAGRPAPAVRLLPPVLPASSLPASPAPSVVCLGLDEQRLEPVWHDFAATPHLLVFGDTETGRTNLLRHVVASIRANYGTGAKIVLGDPRRGLETDVPEEMRAGYAITSDALQELAAQAAVSITRRVPDQTIPPDRLRRRDWWEGPELFVVLDDYELLNTSIGSVLEPLLPLIASSVYTGLHLVVARSTAGAMRGMNDAVLRRIWELGSPAVVFSYPRDEGRFLGDLAPRTLPVGRAQLATRKGASLLQTALVAGAGAGVAGGHVISEGRR